jgi:hypothetical protein
MLLEAGAVVWAGQLTPLAHTHALAPTAAAAALSLPTVTALPPPPPVAATPGTRPWARPTSNDWDSVVAENKRDAARGNGRDDAEVGHAIESWDSAEDFAVSCVVGQLGGDGREVWIAKLQVGGEGEGDWVSLKGVQESPISPPSWLLAQL